MKIASEQLDLTINPPPRQRFYQELEHTVGDRTYVYVAVARELDVRTNVFYAQVSLIKYERVPTQWCKLRNRNYKKVWQLSTSSSATVYTVYTSPSARNLLVECAIKRGIMPTDLLLERTIGPIEDEARREWQRLKELRSDGRLANRRSA